MHTSLRLPRPAARRHLRTVAAVPDYGAAKANNLTSFRGVQPPKSEAHPAPNAHPAWSYGSPRSYSTPAPYGAAKAEDARILAFGGGGFRRVGGGGGGGGGGGRGWGGGGGDAEPWRSITAVWAALIVAGGVAAYQRKGSRKSLEAGAALGAVLAAAAALQTAPRTRPLGLGLAALATAALGTYMGQAYSKSGKTMPHGAFAGVSAALVAGYGAALGAAQRV